MALGHNSGGAMALAQKLGWFSAVERGEMGQATTVPPIGEMVDVSVFALQDMLTILGLYKGPKDGVWGPAVMDALSRWNAPDPASAARFTLTVVPNPADPQTVGFRRQVLTALQTDAQSAVAAGAVGGKARPWWFWPAILTGTGLGIYLLVRLVKKS